MRAFMLSNSERFLSLLEGWEPMFRYFYAIVCTRCFGYVLDFTFLSPLADCVNHSHTSDTSFIMVNKELHLDPMKEKSYFKSDKYLHDVTIMYESNRSAIDKEGMANEELTKGF